jgi:adenosylcobinamide-GDP ribazoletransferase
MTRAFLGAIQFLTVIPVRTRVAPIGRSALFFPIVGAWLGIIVAAMLDAARGYLPFTLSALLVLALLAALTGGLHEDGFADCVDAFRAGRAPEKILAILKDSRIGAHGALALILASLIRWQALSAIVVDPVPALAAAVGISRASAVVLAWITPPAGSGLGAEFSRSLTTPIALAVILQGAALAFWPGTRAAAFLLSAALLAVLGARAYFVRRIGGASGDGLGAVAYVIETLSLVLFSCQPCML